MNVQKFVDDIREQKEGFAFGKPWRYTKSSLAAILPITRKSEEQREYITLAEAGDKVVIEDSGSISEAIVTNKGKKPVFIRAGEMLKGSTQTRAVIVSRVVMPKQTATIKIVCIYASKGIQQGAKFSSAGYTPSSVENTIYNEVHKNDGNANQSNVWGSVRTYSAQTVSKHFTENADNSYASPIPHSMLSQEPNVIRSGGIGGNSGTVNENDTQMGNMRRFSNNSPLDPFYANSGGYASGTDDLEGNMKKFSMTMQELFKSLPKVDWQVGAILITANGIRGLEVFDLPDSWTAMKEDLAEKEAENLVQEDQNNAFEFNPKKAKYMAEVLLKAKFSEKDLYKDAETRTIGIEMDTFVGQVTLLKDTIIHLNLTQKN